MMRNFKKAMLTTVAAVSMMMSLVACGSSKEDYERDVDIVMELEDLFETEDAAEMRDILDCIEMSTKEGKKAKKAFEKAVDMVEEMKQLVADLEEAGEEDYADIEEQALRIMEEWEKALEEIDECSDELLDAAEAAGVE